jgi:hypothetical protein
MNLGILAAFSLADTGAPTWATILVAVLTGLFGFVSGAGVAAAVTTRHERREAFRNRMIEKADQFVERTVSAHLALGQAQHWATAAREADKQGDKAAAADAWKLMEQLVDAAGKTIDELMSLVGYFFVVFPGEAAGEKAVAVHGALVDWRVRVGELATDFDNAWSRLDEHSAQLKAARNDLLQQINVHIRARRL